MVGNHLLEKRNISNLVLNNSNSRTPRLAVSYFQTKRENVIGYMGMNFLLNSINKGLEIRSIDKILSLSNIHGHFLISYFTQ